jgi:hypothetical protein
VIGVDNATYFGDEPSPSTYKKSILFFDEILLLHSETAVARWRDDGNDIPEYYNYADEMEYLVETQYFLPSGKLAGVPISGPSTVELSAALTEVGQRIGEAVDKERGLLLPIDKFTELHALNNSLMTRLAAASLCEFGQPAISVHRLPSRVSGKRQTMLEVGDVIQLAINKVLVPDERTSWEDIFLLKEDREVRDRARKLRLWATKTAKNTSSITQAEEELTDLLADYERFLRAHRLSYQYAGFSSVVTGSAGILEDVVKLKFENLAGRLFSVKKAQAEMALAEMKAPGVDLSLITYANERLI